MLPGLPNRKIQLPILQLPLLHRRAPARIPHPLLGLNDNLVHLIHQILLLWLQPPNDIRFHRARMQAHKCNLWVPPRKFGGVLHVGQLALAVPRPLGAWAEILSRLEGVELHTAWERVEEAGAGEEESTGFAAWSGGRGLEQGQEEFDEQSVRNVVDGELVLVPVGAKGGVGSHDACIEDEDVDFGGQGDDGFSCVGDRREGELVGFDEGQLCRRGQRFGLRNDFIGSGAVAAGEDDMLGRVLS